MLGIIGCGNPLRSDDGIGSFVVRRLKAFEKTEAFRQVRLFDAGTDGMAVMFAARGIDQLIIADAVSSGNEAGSIFEVPPEKITDLTTCPETKDPLISLHNFRWDHALYAGKQIFKEDFPQEIRVFLVEAGSLGFGEELSPQVMRAADVLTRKILSAVENYTPENVVGSVAEKE